MTAPDQLSRLAPAVDSFRDRAMSTASGFSITLTPRADGWEATCMSVASDPRITRRAFRATPAQALAEIARQINRYRYAQRSLRPKLGDSQNDPSPASIRADDEPPGGV